MPGMYHIGRLFTKTVLFFFPPRFQETVTRFGVLLLKKEYFPPHIAGASILSKCYHLISSIQSCLLSQQNFKSLLELFSSFT